MSVDDNDDHPVYNGSGSTAVNATPSGDDIIDGLLGPRKWAGSFITYSDPDSGFDYQSGYFYDDDGDGISAQFDGFSQFTAAQMEVVHAALNSVIYTQPVGAAAFRWRASPTSPSTTRAPARGPARSGSPTRWMRRPGSGPTPSTRARR